ncbi:SEC-C domain-containing protein, partial [bacterium]|nr:SEC-C domain-containing protein [bacterium]
MSKKLGRNDPCWCGSGRKYKHCHLNRGSELTLPIEAIIAKSADSARYQTCLHPEAAPNLCGKISSAHTLQRSRVLKAIKSADHHILTFYPMRFEGEKLKVHRRGWRKAATFDAFCNKHDSTTFAPLESKPFSGSKEQIFLIGYRAVCWELYQKMRALLAYPTIREYIDRGAPLDIQQLIQKSLAVQNAGFRKGYEEVKKVKTAMDEAYLRRDYRAYDTFHVKIKGTLDIAATGAITPNRTLSGVQLQTLHDTSAEIEWLPFGVDVEAGGASILFLWEADAEAPRKYVEEL